MEKLDLKKEAFQKALSRLEEQLIELGHMDEEHKHFEGIRESVIQRFEYSLDAFWKYLREYILVHHGNKTDPSPFDTIREAIKLNLLTVEETEDLRLMIKDRNITSHTYEETLAEAIAFRINGHCEKLSEIFSRLGENKSS